jgi:tetratricopeptide (TPR) repeat protein
LECLAHEPHTRLRYFCSPQHTDSALHPIISQMERAARLTHNDTAQTKLDKLDAVLALASTSAQDAALFAEMLSLPNDGRYPMLELTPQQRRQKTLEALYSQVETFARKSPVLLIFEDAHWADPTSLEAFGRVVNQIATLPVLLLITLRPEFEPPWIGQPHVTALTINRLTRDEIEAMIDRIAGNKLRPVDVRQNIVERSDGIPLFVEEMTKAVLEAGNQDVAERTAAAILSAAVAVPATLHASLMARLDRLAPTSKEIAQVGAAIGRDFSHELLAAVAQRTEAELHEALRRLVEAGLLFQRGLPPQATFQFKHTLVQDAAYGTLLRHQRQRLHARVGTALEEDFPETIKIEPEILAHHFTQAGLTDKAVGFWLRAGKNASARSANIEAIGHLRRGIEAVGQLPDGLPKDRLELDLQFVLGPCIIATRGPIADAALRTFERAHALCERLQDPPEHLNVLYWLAVMRGVQGELREALEATEAGIDLAKVRGDRPALINFLRGCAMAHILMGRPADALVRTEEAVATFNAADDATRIASRAAGQDAGAAALALMAWALWFLGYPDRATIQMTAALNRADAIMHPHTQAYCHYYASILYILRGDFTVARRHAERCLSLSEARGFGLWLNLARIVCGICTAQLEPSSARLEELRTELDDLSRRGQRMGITALYAPLCRLLVQRRRPDTVLETVDEAQKIGRTTDELLFEAEFSRLKARALVMSGSPRAHLITARPMLEQALAVARSQNARSIELLIARDLADLMGELGAREKARELLAPVYGWFTEGFDTRDLKEARALLDGLAS